MQDVGRKLQTEELEEIREDIEALVAKLDRLIAASGKDES